MSMHSGATVQDKEFQEFRTTVSGGVCKGIPNGLKQSRPADARVCYGQVKKLRWDDDDSIVKHKLATMAVQRETFDKRRENSRRSCSPSKRLC
eukprot:Em0100g5a